MSFSVQFTMLVGLPGSGKSTLAQELNHTVVSADSLYEELFGAPQLPYKEVEIYQTLVDYTISELELGNSVVIDATNLDYKKRTTFLRAVTETVPEVHAKAVMVATPFDVCLERNAQRDKVIEEHVMFDLYTSTTIPQFYEGWDEIDIHYTVDTAPYTFNSLFYGDSHMSGLVYEGQDNPNHSLTIGDHCIKAAEECTQIIETLKDEAGVNELFDEEYVKCAALYHDIGKRETKSFCDSRGTPTDIAHYFDHHYVSAYNALFYLKEQFYTTAEILRIALYIQWHMQPYFIHSEKAERRLLRRVGQQIFDNLYILNSADKQAK